jgi:hypothetical protein
MPFESRYELKRGNIYIRKIQIRLFIGILFVGGWVVGWGVEREGLNFFEN